jgi:hypothetical protein
MKAIPDSKSPMEEEHQTTPSPTSLVGNQRDHNPNISTYITQTKEILHYEIQLPAMVQHIIYMKDHAPISRFMGLWPSEKALLWWIKTGGSPKEILI